MREHVHRPAAIAPALTYVRHNMQTLIRGLEEAFAYFAGVPLRSPGRRRALVSGKVDWPALVENLEGSGEICHSLRRGQQEELCEHRPNEATSWHARDRTAKHGLSVSARDHIVREHCQKRIEDREKQNRGFAN